MSRILWTSLLLVCFLFASTTDGTDTGADFLESVIWRMQNDRIVNSGGDPGEYLPTPLPEHHLPADSQMAQSDDPLHGPPLSKAELLALYQAAVTKGSGLDLSALPQLPLGGNEDDQHQEEAIEPSDQGTLPGYYYYFYPINSFLPDNSSDMASLMNGSHHDTMMMMMDDNGMADDMKETRVDPLFLAMAGFVSMATIVSFSILFLPKFGDSRSQQKSALKRVVEEDDDEMFSLSQVVGQAIQGKDCVDRLACELGKAIHSMQLGQKPLRVLEIMLPPNLAKQMSQIRQHMTKKEKCQFIPCKKLKRGPQPLRNSTNKNTNNQNNSSKNPTKN